MRLPGLINPASKIIGLHRDNTGAGTGWPDAGSA
jgi:hypothetical protein